MPEREGQRFGNYRLVHLLGKGAFAEVYLGEHLFLKSYSALKVLLTPLHEKDEQLFLTEAQMLAQLVHPNIVRVHDFAVEQGTAFLAMDYAPGGTLRHRHARGARLPLDLVMNYVRQAAAALQYAHNRGIVHRDVKPENLLQGPEGVLLGDFGISVYLEKMAKEHTQQLAGTLPYMAPEQARGRAVFASDQYALAAIVYEWLCGVCPFEGSAVELLYRHATVPPPHLREHDPSLPAAVEAVVLKALAKAPEDRYPAIQMFAWALERAIRESMHNSDSSPMVFSQPSLKSPVVPGSPGPVAMPRRILLSHAPADDPAPLKVDLEIRDVMVIESSGLEDEEAIRQAVRAVQVVLLLVSPQTRATAVVREHLRIAALYQRPLLCVWMLGENVQDLLPAGIEAVALVDARAHRYNQALDEIVDYLERERRGNTDLESMPVEGTTIEPRNPYKGLHPFMQSDSADFFGREVLVQQLIRALQNMLPFLPTGEPGRRLLALVGPSGSGKSSVAMAGLLPQLQAGALPTSEWWVYLEPLVPAYHPLDVLAHILAAHIPGKSAAAIRETLEQEGSYGLHRMALSLVHERAYVVLLIDQFEELFSPEVSEQERRHFIDLLVTAVTEPRGRVLVLLTLRADFYDRPMAYPALGRLIQQHHPVLPMETQDLRAVIERPALQPGVELVFDEDLIGDLLFDMHNQAGMLPLLEFTLEQLFYHRRGHRLTRRTYEEIGGVRGALARHAEATYEALPSDEHRRMTRQVFLRLVLLVSSKQEPIRRCARLAEFTLERAEQTRILQEVIDAFVKARLLTTNRIAGETTLEVSHEALLREWPRLADWVRQAGEDLHLQQQLSSDVAEWERRGKPRDRLYRGTQLKELQIWQERNTASAQEVAFLHAGKRRQRQERLRLLMVGLLLVGLLIPAGLLVYQPFASPVVTTLQDGAPGSLRRTIESAKPGSIVTFDPLLKGTLSLTSKLDISKDLIIRAPDPNRLTITGSRDRGYLIGILAGAHVTFSNLAFTASRPSAGSLFNNAGTLTLEQCNISGIVITGTNVSLSQYGRGGGPVILNDKGTLLLKNTTIAHVTVNNVDTVVGGGIGSINGTVTLDNSRIENITIDASTVVSGGAICIDAGKLTLIRSTIADNRVMVGQQSSQILSGGGGIAAIASQVSLIDSTISNNSITAGAMFGGGGIMSSGEGASLTLKNTVVENNTVTSRQQKNAGGGGIFADYALSITNSIIRNNTVISTTSTEAIAGNGGGISVSGTLTMNNSTVAGNRVRANNGTAAGGGIVIFIPLVAGENLRITNSTISGNTASGKLGGKGGGIDARGSRGSIDFCTIYGNSANTHGGGLSFDVWHKTSDVMPDVTLKNSFVAGNTAPAGPDIAGKLTTRGYNLVQRFDGINFDDPYQAHKLDHEQNQLAMLKIDPQLRAQGGPTPTHALLAGSPAINQIPANACDVPADQRGVARPQQGACDIGAYEYKL